MEIESQVIRKIKAPNNALRPYPVFGTGLRAYLDSVLRYTSTNALFLHLVQESDYRTFSLQAFDSWF
jgi:hypothetical protein